MEAMTPPSLEHTLALAFSLMEVLTMFMEEATKLRGKEVAEEKKFIEAETLNDVMADGGSESSKHYDKMITAEQEIQKSELALCPQQVPGNHQTVHETKINQTQQSNCQISHYQSFKRESNEAAEVENRSNSQNSEETELLQEKNFDTIVSTEIHSANQSNTLKVEQIRLNAYTYACDQCKYIVTRKSSLSRHKRFIHDGNGLHMKTKIRQLNCGFCDIHFTQTSSLKRHNISKHPGNGEFVCTICEQKCESKSLLKKHTESVHRNHICKECGLKFPWNCDNCSQHNSRACKMCSKICADLTALTTHVNKHLQIKPFSCEQCHTSYRSKCHLNKHYNIKHSSEKNKAPANGLCAECGKVFRRSYMKCSKHSKKRSAVDLSCKKGCGYTTKSIGQLKSHHNNQTARCNSEKPLLRIFFCSMCESSFTTKKYKQKHENMHIEGKKHICKICHKQFSESWNLKQHSENIHNLNIA